MHYFFHRQFTLLLVFLFKFKFSALVEQGKPVLSQLDEFSKNLQPFLYFFGESVTFTFFLHTLFWSNANPNTNCCSFVRYCKLEQHCKLLAMTFLDTPLKPGARKGASNRYHDRIISCSDLFDDFIFYMSKEDHPSPRIALFYG